VSYRALFSPDTYLNEFRAFLGTVAYSERNPLNTEMFFLWCMIRTFKPKLFVESGTFRGYSAQFICEALARNANDAEFITLGFNLDDCLPFARRRLAPYPFAQVIEVDSRLFIRQLAREDRPSAFFIDGPKGRNMPPLFEAIERRFSNILFIAVHDCERESGSRNRRHVEQYYGVEFPIIYCDAAFQVPLQELDEGLIGRSELTDWRPFFFRGAPRASYGTETAYVLTQQSRLRIPRLLLRPYRWARCLLLRGRL
jgi:predicted O-methyltransferase YrrM